MIAIASSSSSLSSRLAELRGYALLAFCLALTSGFVVEMWRAPPARPAAAGVAAQDAAAGYEPAKVRS
jgi:hypothetical protein